MDSVRSFFRDLFTNFRMVPMHPTDTYGEVMTELRERQAKGHDQTDRSEISGPKATPGWVSEFHKIYGGVWSKR